MQAAIGDSVAAVQALDYLGNVLGLLGSTPLPGPLAFRDQQGTPRLFMPWRTWEDYLTPALTEIREYGSTSDRQGIGGPAASDAGSRTATT